jgi:hypothetical protein
MQALYAGDIIGNDPDQLLNTIIKTDFNANKNNYNFAEQLFYRTVIIRNSWMT